MLINYKSHLATINGLGCWARCNGIDAVRLQWDLGGGCPKCPGSVAECRSWWAAAECDASPLPAIPTLCGRIEATVCFLPISFTSRPSGSPTLASENSENFNLSNQFRMLCSIYPFLSFSLLLLGVRIALSGRPSEGARSPVCLQRVAGKPTAA